MFHAANGMFDWDTYATDDFVFGFLAFSERSVFSASVGNEAICVQLICSDKPTIHPGCYVWWNVFDELLTLSNPLVMTSTCFALS